MNRTLIVTTLSLLLAASGAFGQRRDRFMPFEAPRMTLLFQPLYFGTGDSTLRRVDIPYRADLSFFVPTRSGLASVSRPLTRKGEILFEFFDSLGISAGRAIEDVDQSTDEVETPPGVHHWYQGIAKLQVPPGRYSIVAELTDLESKRDFTDKNEKAEVPHQTSAPGLGSVFFASGSLRSAFPDTIIVQDLGKDFRFGAPGYIVAMLPGVTDTTGLMLGYTIDENKGSSDLPGYTLHVQSAPYLWLSSCNLTAFSDTDRVGYVVSRGGGMQAVAIPMPLAHLPLRNYSITVTVNRGALKADATQRCQAVWPEMPASLRDVDRALEALRILIPDAEVEKLTKGSFEERRNKLEDFWKSRSKDTISALNPLMAEFYHRVDFAVRSFGTLRDPDGLKSDRGRIYVLYGPPSSTKRTLTPGRPYQEVWTYDALNKRFVFEDTARNGNYVLLSTSSL